MPRRSSITIQASGRRYRLGRTPEYGGIWRKRLWGWRLVSRYPLTEEGWRVAADQFRIWEPEAQAPNSVKKESTAANHRRRRPAGWWIIAVLAVLLVSAGGVYLGTRPSSSPSHPANAVGTGYLAKGSGFVIFIQWNDDNGSLRGSAQVLTTTGEAPNLTNGSQTVSVTGSLEGSTITLSFNDGAPTFGTLSNGSFTVNFPQSDGSLSPVTFASATASQYNTALAKLNNEITKENRTAENAEELAQEQQKINEDASSVSSDIAALSQDDSGALSDAQAIAATLQGESQDLAATKTAAQQVQAEGPGEDTCGDAEDVGGDAEDVAGDAEDVEGDAEDVSGDIQGVQKDISQLQEDFSTLRSDESNLPGYTPTGTPTQAEVKTAVANANSAIASAISIANGFINQGNADVTTAYSNATAAYQAGGCGTPPSAPSPEPLLSS